jgi:hypothetical protein
MSTSSVTPDPSSLASAVPSSTPSNYVEQSSQNPAPPQPAPVAPQPQVPAAGPRLASVLSAIVGASTPAQPAQPAQPNTPSPTQPAWKSTLGKVAGVVSTGLAGVPAGGRPSFMGGLGQGARSAQAAEAQQQDIKFKDFDTQVRLANLHNQDKELQLRTQEQQDAHQKSQDEQSDFDEAHGISFDPHPNDGKAVLDTLQGQTQANGAAEVPPGTHLSADGQTVNVPDNSQETQAGLLEKYKQLQGPLSLPALPQNAQFVPGRNLDVLTHKLGGYKADGTPWNHDDLPGQISSLQSQRDALAKSGANQYQLGTLNNTIGILQSNLKALDDHAAGVKQAGSQADEQGKINAQMSPQGRALAQSNEKLAEQKQDNAAGDKAANAKADTNMYVGTDATGNQVAGTSDQLKAAGAQGVTKMDADTGKKVVTARELISPDGLFAQIKQDMLNLDAKGKMGSSATARFNDALLSKAGSDADYAPLFVHTHLLSTALMQAHVGSRGSSDMMEEFQKLANSGKMSASTLRSALGAEYSYVKGKALLPKTQPSQTSNGGGQ